MLLELKPVTELKKDLNAKFDFMFYLPRDTNGLEVFNVISVYKDIDSDVDTEKYRIVKYNNTLYMKLSHKRNSKNSDYDNIIKALTRDKTTPVHIIDNVAYTIDPQVIFDVIYSETYNYEEFKKDMYETFVKNLIKCAINNQKNYETLDHKIYVVSEKELKLIPNETPLIYDNDRKKKIKKSTYGFNATHNFSVTNDLSDFQYPTAHNHLNIIDEEKIDEFYYQNYLLRLNNSLHIGFKYSLNLYMYHSETKTLYRIKDEKNKHVLHKIKNFITE